jgi:hypothetical protein
MTEIEWQRIVTKVLDLWGASPKWVSARTAVYEYARNLDYQKTTDVISALFNAGRPTAPSPSEIVADARLAGALQTDLDTDCTHPNWAILTYHTDGTASTGLCAACHTERTWPPGHIRTVGDLEHPTEQRPNTHDEQTAMIAP